MKIIVAGSGGREHALAWSMRAHEVIVVPGNDGIARDFHVRAASSTSDVIDVCTAERPDLVVVGPEKYLDEGIADALALRNIPCFGPRKNAARLESDKAFMKDIARAAGVRTADYVKVTTVDEARPFLDERRARGVGVVVKAAGLCAGKGVVVCADADCGEGELRAMLGGDGQAPRFGEASRTVVLEDLLRGDELSVFALCNGDDAVILGAARDHKRLNDGDTGPNTGGMGAVGPLGNDEGVSDAFLATLRDTVFLPTLRELNARGMPFVGVLFAGLMVHDGEASLLEFNVRFGDPETQALLFAADTDLAPLLLACAKGQPLDASMALPMQTKGAVVVVAAAGYPDDPEPGAPILGVFDAAAIIDADVFFAGVKNGPFGLTASGGRVLGVVGRGDTFDSALNTAYAAVDVIRMEGAQVRRDVGVSVRGESK